MATATLDIDRDNHCVWFVDTESSHFRCKCDKFFNAGSRCCFENDGLQAKEICKYYRVSNIKQVMFKNDEYTVIVNNKVVGGVFSKEDLVSLKELIEKWLTNE
jgi:hypothetical protein